MKKLVLALTVSLISSSVVAHEKSVISSGAYFGLANQTIEDIDYTGFTLGYNLNATSGFELTHSMDQMDLEGEEATITSLTFVKHFNLTSRIKLETKIGGARGNYEYSGEYLDYSADANFLHYGMGLSANFENGISVKMMNENYVREGHNTNGTSVNMQYRF